MRSSSEFAANAEFVGQDLFGLKRYPYIERIVIRAPRLEALARRQIQS